MWAGRLNRQVAAHDRIDYEWPISHFRIGLMESWRTELWNPKHECHSCIVKPLDAIMPVWNCLENEGDVCIGTGEQWLSCAQWRIYVGHVFLSQHLTKTEMGFQIKNNNFWD